MTAHLSDDQLMETCVLAGDNRHLAACRPCKTRFDELVRSLQQIHEAAIDEADSVFTADRLHDQRDRIMRRIERHDHPAEVVAFPHQRVGSQPRRPSPARSRPPLGRWRGGGGPRGRRVPRVRDGSQRARPRNRPVATQQSNTSLARQAAADDQFFIEIDEALVGSRAREMRPDLSAIDVMTTPLEIREVSYVRE